METENAEPTETPASAGFVVSDRASAEWALKKIHAKDAEIALLDAQYHEMRRGLVTDAEGFRARFGGQLEAWAREQVDATDGRVKTIRTLAGSLAFRTVPSRLTIESQEDAITTAKATCPEAVTTVEKLDTRALLRRAQEVLLATGELLPGIGQAEARESFAIKFARDDERSAPIAAGKGTESGEEEWGA